MLAGFVLVIGLILIICFMERAQRRVLIQYPKRQTARGMMQADKSHLPLKINTANVIPPIFASSLLALPLTITQFAGKHINGESRWGDFIISPEPVYRPGYAALFRALCGWASSSSRFFYTAVVFNPEETADNLKRYGGFIPGIRPGKNTETYLDYVLTRITVIGAAYLTLICVVPEMFIPRHLVGFRRHQPADRGQRHDRHGHADPEPSARASIWRPDQEGAPEGRSCASVKIADPARTRRARGRARRRSC